MPTLDPSVLVPDLLALARRAGQAIVAVRHVSMTRGVKAKTDGSPVTDADRAAHRVIGAGLAKLTPDWAVVSEEDDGSSSQAPGDCFWLVDPLDGTREFLRGSDEFTVNIALIEASRVRFGVVQVPMTGELFWGGAGLGAWVDQGQGPLLLRVTPPSIDGRWRVVASQSHHNAQTDAWLGRIGEIELVRAGSSLKFCRVAQGLADLYPRLGPTREWDTAAAQAVLEGAGGHVYDLSGQPLRYGKRDILNPDFIASSMGFEAVSRRLQCS